VECGEVPDGAWVDSWNLWLLKKLLGADRAIAIVPHDWFTYHGLGAGTFGITFSAIPVSFVTDNFPLITAHEVGHTYNLHHVQSLAAAQTHGYWVQVPKEVPTSLDYMLPGSLPGVTNSLVPDPVFPSDDLRSSPKGTERWSSQGDFATLFQKFSVPPPLDPETLLLTGLIDASGNVTLGPFYRAANGTVDQPPAGTFGIQLVDFSGNIISEVPFRADLTVYDVDPSVVVDSAPFALAVSFPNNAARVQVTHAGVVVARVNVTTKLLSDAINSIPDAGFIQNPSERRGALLSKIDELDSQISAGALNGALNNLQNDIRNQLVQWLVDGYAVQSPLQYTKPQILALVDELLKRLGA
jgi:hypothetical protein